MAVRKLIAAAFALACPLTAAAFEGQQRDLKLIAESIHGASIAVDYEVKWKLSSLMGEPTRNLKIRWRLPRFAAIRLPNDPAYEGAPANFLVKNLPPDIQDSIRLYDVKIPMGFRGRPAGYDCSSLYAVSAVAEGYVTFDAGAPAKPGDKWSYNVTGSPNWAEFMTDFQGVPLSKDTAKSVMTTPNLCGDVDDLKVTGKIALGEALRWIHKSFDKRSVTEMITGSQRQLEVLSETLGLPVDDAISEFDRLTSMLSAARSAAEIAEIRQQVEAAAQKLRDGIPARYVPADKVQDYQAERDDISTQTEQILVELIPDESGYDAEAAAYQQWVDERPTETLYRSERISDDIKRITTWDGEHVREVDNWEYDLLAGRYLHAEISCEDERVDLLDPTSLEIAKTLRFDCPDRGETRVALWPRFLEGLERPEPITSDYLETLEGYKLTVTNSNRVYYDDTNRCKSYRDRYEDTTVTTTFGPDFEQIASHTNVEQSVKRGSAFCLSSY